MALLPGSPTLDAGSVALAVDANGNPLLYDQRGPGYPRVINGTVDIGAYEFTPFVQTINFGPLANQTYGVSPITLNATASSNLPVTFSVMSGPATVSGNVLTVTGAGNVVIAASQPGNATYSAAVPVDESFTVAPASLTITPTTGESMTYGGTVPALTYTYTGLVNGDTSATFSGGLVTSATSSSSVGGYPITQGSLFATGNYTIGTFNPGTLTVNAAPLTITPTAGQSMVYGAAVPALTYTASGFVNSDPASLLTGAGHDSHLDQRGRQLSLHAGLPDRGNELRAGPGSQPARLRNHTRRHDHAVGVLGQPIFVRPSGDLYGHGDG